MRPPTQAEHPLRFKAENPPAEAEAGLDLPQAVPEMPFPGAASVIAAPGATYPGPAGTMLGYIYTQLQALDAQQQLAAPGGVGAVVVPTDANFQMSAAVQANGILNVTSSVSLTAQRNVQLAANPVAGTRYWVINNTTGGQAIQIIGTSGTGIVIATAKRAEVFWDGTNVVRLTGDQ